MISLLRSAALAVAVVMAAAQVAFAQPLSDPAFQATTLRLTAYGETKVVPDLATINLGVQTDAATAAQAMQANADEMARVVAALKRAGVAERDLRTSELNVAAQYTYIQNQPPKLSGYQATNQLTVTLHDMTRVGRVVDAAAAAGVTQVNAIRLGLADPTAAEDQARLAAVRALTARAELYAKALGHPIVRLVSVSEGALVEPRVGEVMATAVRMQAAPVTPVLPGESTVRVQVSGVYELAR